MKKLRYGVEFLAPFQRRKQVKAFLHGCKALQQHLGTMNDASVADAGYIMHRLAKCPSVQIN